MFAARASSFAGASPWTSAGPLRWNERELAGRAWPGAIGQRLNRLAEVVFVCEIAIHAGKPDVSDPVGLAKLFHRQLANCSRTHFRPPLLLQLILNFIDPFLDVPGQDGALGARCADCRSQLLPG